MRRSIFRRVTLFGLSLGFIGTLIAFADSVGTVSPATLTADGLLTPRTRAVISGEYAYLLGPPEIVVADARIDKYAASPTGDAILIAAYKRRPFHGVALTPADAEPVTRELNLVYWDTRTRTAKTLLRESVQENSRAEIEQIGWLPRTRIALIVLNRMTLASGQPKTLTKTLLRADTAAGTVSRVADVGSGAGLEVSPNQPLAYVSIDENTGAKDGPLFRRSLRVYTPQGFRPPFAIPDGVIGLTWMSDGKSVYSDRIVERNSEGKIKSRKGLNLIELETGKVTQPEKLPVIPRTAATGDVLSPRESWAVDVTAADVSLQTPAGKSEKTSALWLRAARTGEETVAAPSVNGPISKDSLLIATNAHLEIGLVTENTSAVLFTRDGSLCASPIFRLPAQAFEDTLRRIQRTTTMTNAKQIGIAIMMYAQDYDDTFPIPGNGVQDAAGPYLNNPAVFNNPGTGENGFVYSYNGPASLSAVGQPSATQLGYVLGPGGRAVIWADGHVTWEDTP